MHTEFELVHPLERDGDKRVIADVPPPARAIDLRDIQIILKTSERCNIACRYCYFFFSDNQTYKEHPPLIGAKVISDLVAFLQDGLRTMPGVRTLTIGFHGGEPMLQRRRDFDATCEALIQGLASMVELDLVIQTNGMLINDAWIDSFARYNVRVGVSLDGPASLHDLDRIDHMGRGTHERAIRGLNQALAAYRAGVLKREPSVLCVINPNVDARALYAYFREELGLRVFDFLLPEGELSAAPTAYGRFLVDLFDCWVEEGNADLGLRFFRALIAKFSGHSSFIFPVGADPVRSAVFKVSSDGRLYPDDVLHHSTWNTPALKETTLAEWLASPYFRDMANLAAPSQCEECCWVKVCGGGHPWNRFEADGGFDRPSSLCDGLKPVFARVYRYLLSIGVPQDRLLNVLSID